MAAASPKGRNVNRTELSDLYGVSLPTVDTWVRNGMPGVKVGAGKGGAWTFNTAEVAKWREQRAADEAAGDTVADEAALKKRKLFAETVAAEHETALKKGLVAPLDQVERAMTRVFAEIRTNMRSLPARTVTLLIGETDERAFKAVMLREIDVVLESLADFDVLADEALPDDAGDA